MSNMENVIKQYIAGRAVIVKDGRVLIIRESVNYIKGANKGRYDLPGGKIEPGESFNAGLVREVHEECGLDIVIGKPIYLGEWSPNVNGVHHQIFGIYCLCTSDSSNVILKEDHDEYLWIKPADCDKYDLIPPNKEVLRLMYK